jgi:hypothetical protein
MISTCDSNMRLQQYRLISKLSKTSPAFSPALTLRANSSHLSPINLPHVKHLTGMIIPVSPLIGSFSGLWPVPQGRRIFSVLFF